VPTARPMCSPRARSPNELDRVREPRLVLVLTRKAKQSIMIGDEIEVRVLSNDGTKVRLGIQAPSNVPVHRTEVYLAIQAQDRDTADSHERHDLTPAPASRQGR
jgi:carbon storage regulator